MDETAGPEIDARIFRRAMSRFPTGVTVITASDGGAARGMTANAFMSGSLEPPLCVISIAKRAHMHTLLSAVDRFGVNVLAHEQMELSDHFAGSPNPKLEIAFELLEKVPLLVDCCARIVATSAVRHDCGDHTLFIGHIVHMDASDRPPLVYHAGRYGALIHSRGDHEVALPEFW